MAVTAQALRRGRSVSIYALLKGPRCEVRRFIDRLPEKDRRPLLALLKRTAENGPPHNPERFRHEEDGIFVFKRKGERLYCFRDGTAWVLTHGVRKQRDKARPEDLAKAKRLRGEFRDGGSIYVS